MPKPSTPDPVTEVVARPENARGRRRQFSTEEKQRILAEAERCAERGELSALLRREGIYSTQLNNWRHLLASQGLEGLRPKSAGRKPIRDARDEQVAKLEREKARLEHELMVARKLLELAGKAHEILGVALPSLEDDEKP